MKKIKLTFNDDIFGSDLEAVIADARYKYIARHYAIAKKRNPEIDFESESAKIDRVLTHKWFGIPIFLCILFLVNSLKATIVLSRKTYEIAGGFAEEMLYNIKTHF